jgi:hypothetical protein
MAGSERIDQIDNLTSLEITTGPLSDFTYLLNKGIDGTGTTQTARKAPKVEFFQLLRAHGLFQPEQLTMADNFTVAAADSGRLLILNAATAKTITLSDVGPVRVYLVNIGTANWTFTGALTTLTIEPGQGGWLEKNTANNWKFDNIDLITKNVTDVTTRTTSIESWKSIVGTQRWLPYFDGTRHATLATPINTSGVLTVEIDFTAVPDGVLRYLLDGITADATNRFTVSISAGGSLAIPSTGRTSATLDGLAITTSTPLGSSTKVRKLVISYSGTTYKIGSIARQYLSGATSSRWKGYISRLKITVDGTPQTFAMTSRSTVSEANAEASNTLNFASFISGAWEEKSIAKNNDVIAPRVEGYFFVPKKVYIRRISATIYYMYQACVDGKWTRYELRRDTDVPRNVDVFRIWQVQVGNIPAESPLDTNGLTDNLIVIQTGAQNEYAIKPAGAADFMGGQHGDEELLGTNGFGLYLDGRPITLTDDQVVAGDKFEFVQNTEFFAPTGSTGLTVGSKVADVRSRLIWDERGYSVDADFIWTQGFNITAAFGCMAAINRLDTVSTKGRYHASNAVLDISSGVADFTDAGGSYYGAEIWNDTNKISASVEVEPGWIDDFTTSKTFIDREAVYAKIYPAKIHTTQKAVTSGQRWKLKGTYKINSGI